MHKKFKKIEFHLQLPLRITSLSVDLFNNDTMLEKNSKALNEESSISQALIDRFGYLIVSMKMLFDKKSQDHRFILPEVACGKE